jgi:hypothetical protein
VVDLKEFAMWCMSMIHVDGRACDMMAVHWQVVKAKPVPTSVYNGGPAVVHSSKPLTEPMSPHFRYVCVRLLCMSACNSVHVRTTKMSVYLYLSPFLAPSVHG